MILVGGVGQLWQGDLDVGRLAAERLAAELPARHPRGSVVVEDLYYGAVAVAQRLQDLDPAALILVGARERGRAPGSVEVRRIDSAEAAARRAHGAVADAVTGYVDIDLVVDVAAALGALPAVTVTVEIEPDRVEPDEHLSDAGRAGLEQALAAVGREVEAIASSLHPRHS